MCVYYTFLALKCQSQSQNEKLQKEKDNNKSQNTVANGKAGLQKGKTRLQIDETQKC